MVEARCDDIFDPTPRVDHSSPPKPGEVYGVAKLAGEAMVRYFSETHGIVYGVSNNRTRFRDFEHTTALVGYIPEDGAEW